MVPEEDEELMSYNDQLLEDAKKFAFGKHSPRNNSRNKKNLDYDVHQNFATQGNDEDGSFGLAKNRRLGKRLSTETAKSLRI